MSRIKKIGIELEIPLVSQNYLAANFSEVEKLFLDFSKKGWSKKKDLNTEALVGVKRTSTYGEEVLSNDLGVCVFEAALAPVSSLDDAIEYWLNFKSSELLPILQKNGLKMLGYGTQPVSSDLKNLIARKGHYTIWTNMLEESSSEWILQNFPGLCSAQFNFEIPKEEALKILNTFLQQLAFLWTAGANDSVVAGKSLPYKSQRFHAFKTLAQGRMYGRCGTPINSYNSLCDYIKKTWNVPIFSIIRDEKFLYPKDIYLTTNRFIAEGVAEFYNLDQALSQQKICLEDLKNAIYFAWLDYRLKFNFYKEATFEALLDAVCSEDDLKLFDLIEYIIFEIRPLSMQANEEEISWLILTYLMVENIDSISDYSMKWTYNDVKLAAKEAQVNGLSQYLNDKTLGEIGLDLLSLIPEKNFSVYEKYLLKLQDRFIKECSPSDEALRILNNQGLEALLKHLTIDR